MNKVDYLKRINYQGVIGVTDEVLTSLHKQHVFHVPFENLDIHYKRIFNLDIERVYQKVIDDKRGGFCYELNFLFNWLLTELGFSSRIIASRIFSEDGIPGPEFDHMSVIANTGKDFLVDVGYGDLFVTPIEIKKGIQSDGRNYFQIDEWNENEYVLSMSVDGKSFSRRYTFSLDPVDIEDFALICLDKQTNPNSYFVKNVVCTKPTDTGRITIFNNKLVEKSGGLKIENNIESEEHLTKYLQDNFGVKVRQ